MLDVYCLGFCQSLTSPLEWPLIDFREIMDGFFDCRRNFDACGMVRNTSSLSCSRPCWSGSGLINRQPQPLGGSKHDSKICWDGIQQHWSFWLFATSFLLFPPPHFYSVCYMITFFSGTYSQDKLFPLLMSRSSQLKISWPWSISLYPSHPCVCRTPFMVSLRSMQTLGIAEGLMFSKGQSST